MSQFCDIIKYTTNGFFPVEYSATRLFLSEPENELQMLHNSFTEYAMVKLNNIYKQHDNPIIFTQNRRTQKSNS